MFVPEIINSPSFADDECCATGQNLLFGNKKKIVSYYALSLLFLYSVTNLTVYCNIVSKNMEDRKQLSAEIVKRFLFHVGLLTQFIKKMFVSTAGFNKVHQTASSIHGKKNIDGKIE